jgi:hypothetical protein
VLAYLDSLCTALLAGDGLAIRTLLGHPLARTLPRSVREEALAIARTGRRSLRAPVHTLHFYHQTVHLLGAQVSEPIDALPQQSVERSSAADKQSVPTSQMELPLRAKLGPRARAIGARRR